MACSYIDRLSDDLLIAIFWPSKRFSTRRDDDDLVWPCLQPSSRLIRRNDEPCYQQSGDTAFPNASLPPALADAAYNLLLASTCRRWRRLAQDHVSTLLVKKNRVVPCEVLAAAVACFPNLTHLHLCDKSLDNMDDAFLARLAASCPKLTAFHLGKWIVQRLQHDDAEEHLTLAGFDAFFRQCTRLEHLSLNWPEFRSPDSIFQLVRLRSLALNDVSDLLTPDVRVFSALTALSMNAPIWDYEGLENLAQLPSLTSLSVPDLIARVNTTPRFSFAHLSSLKSLYLGTGWMEFDFMFPPDSPCSRLERLTFFNRDELSNLPDDINYRLPSLQVLTINECQNFSEQPEQVTSLRCLRSLNLFNCRFAGLPDSFGEMPYLTRLVLYQLDVNFPASCSRLKSLQTLIVTECSSLVELPAPLGALTSLKTLCLADSPLLILPDDMGKLLSLETFFLKPYRARPRLPSSFTQLASLARLELQECDIVELPEAMGELRCLRQLYIVSCSQIQKLPESVLALLSLEILVVDKCASLFSVPQNLINLTKLKQLELTGCEKMRIAPEFLPCSLEFLSLGGPDVVIHLPDTYTLPNLKRASMSMAIFPSALSKSLSPLEHLHLVMALEEDFPFRLADLPCLRTLTVASTGAVKLPHFSSSALQELRQLELRLPKLTELPATIAALRKLTYLEIDAPKLRSLPDSIGALTRLCKLILSNCPALKRLPDSLTQLSYLRVLQVRRSRIKSLPSNFGQLSRLRVLDLQNCKQLEFLSEELLQLKLLRRLNVDGCDKLRDSCGRLGLPGWLTWYTYGDNHYGV